jgi:hypothetical protein
MMECGRTACVAAALMLALAVGIGCGGGGVRGASSEAVGGRGSPSLDETSGETVARSHCPPGLASCRATDGRIVYVERVDPDGDGDVHFVIADSGGITLPGLTAIDVRKGLRPHPLPGIGDLISAAGPVQTGSYGQSQIHALELHVAPTTLTPQK